MWKSRKYMYPELLTQEQHEDVHGKYLKFSLSIIPPFLAEYAEKNLNETEENRIKCLKELKEILKNDKDIETMDDDSMLLLFLRFKKFDVRRAADFFRTNLKYVDSYRCILEKDDPALIRRVVRANIAGFLPHRDAKGRAILYIKSDAWDPEKISADDCILGGIVTIQSAAFNPVSQVVGYVVVMDLANLKMQQVIAMSRWLLFGVITLQKMCPCFMKTFHIINIPPIFKTGWKIVKPILSDKIKKRIVFHKGSDLSTLYEHLPREILPKELGGTTPFSNDHWAWDIDSLIAKYRDRLSSNGYKNRKKRKPSLITKQLLATLSKEPSNTNSQQPGYA